VWAGSGYAGKLVDWAAERLALTVRIVAKLAGQTTFVVLPAGGAWSARSPGPTAAAAPSATTNADPTTTQ
jgi:hypothetical protein